MHIERKLTHPGFWMAVVLSVMVVLIQAWLSTPLTILDEVFVRVLQLPKPGLAQNPLMVGLVNIIALGAPIALGLYWNRLPFRSAFPLVRLTLPQIGAMLVAILGLDVLLSEADNVMRSIVPPPRFFIEAYRQVFTNQGNIVERIFLLVIVAPVTEELLFRGIILRGLLSRYGPVLSVGVTAFLFGVVHLNPWQFVSAFWLGVAFGWFYLRTGSINIAILGHAISNGLFVFFTSLPSNIPGLTTSPDPEHVLFQPWWLDLAGAMILVAGLFAFAAATRRSQALPEPGPLADEAGPRIV